MLRYCDKCQKKIETKTATKDKTFNVRGENITVTTQVLVCPRCGEEFFSEELDDAALVSAHNEYRKRHNLLFPDEIKQIRERYDFNQPDFAKFLSWEEETICKYENGVLPSEEHNRLLVFLRKPENMRIWLSESARKYF